jgi:hypothetical protein
MGSNWKKLIMNAIFATHHSHDILHNDGGFKPFSCRPFLSSPFFGYKMEKLSQFQLGVFQGTVQALLHTKMCHP